MNISVRNMIRKRGYLLINNEYIFDSFTESQYFGWYNWNIQEWSELDTD